MKLLYLTLDVGTLLFPLLLSFDRKVHYHTHWKYTLLSSMIIAIPFLAWDILFTLNGVWGFNEKFLTGISICHLPIEEILFFFAVPFACTFIYVCLKSYLTAIKSDKINIITIFLITSLSAIVFSINPFGWYSASVATSSLIVVYFLWKKKTQPYIGMAFLLSLLPFLVVNGILTGSLIDEPVVWYNNQENINIRLGTIPVEDILYSFSLIIPNILLFEKISMKAQ